MNAINTVEGEIYCALLFLEKGYTVWPRYLMPHEL